VAAARTRSSSDEAVAATDAALDEVDRSRDLLAGLLQQLIDPAVDAASWQQHGALLASLDRLRVELRAAVEPTDESWRPAGPFWGAAAREVLRTGRGDAS